MVGSGKQDRHFKFFYQPSGITLVLLRTFIRKIKDFLAFRIKKESCLNYEINQRVEGREEKWLIQTHNLRPGTTKEVQNDLLSCLEGP